MEIRSSRYSFAALRQELNIQRKAIRAEMTKRSKAEFGQLQEKQEEIWIANGELARSPGLPFYQRLNDLLDSGKFDLFVEGLCRKFYAPRMGRPSLAPGIYFRSLLIGYLRGSTVAASLGGRPTPWRCGNLCASRSRSPRRIIRRFRGHGGRSMWGRAGRCSAGWRGLLADGGLLKGKRVGVDATNVALH